MQPQGGADPRGGAGSPGQAGSSVQGTRAPLPGTSSTILRVEDPEEKRRAKRGRVRTEGRRETILPGRLLGQGEEWEHQAGSHLQDGGEGV